MRLISSGDRFLSTFGETGADYIIGYDIWIDEPLPFLS